MDASRLEKIVVVLNKIISNRPALTATMAGHATTPSWKSLKRMTATVIIVLPPLNTVAFTTAATLVDLVTAKLGASKREMEFTCSPF